MTTQCNDLKARFMATRFSMWDLQLYLDTHPRDLTAQALFDKYRRLYAALLPEYEEQYGPITSEGSETAAAWLKAPWPWDNTRGNC